VGQLTRNGNTMVIRQSYRLRTPDRGLSPEATLDILRDRLMMFWDRTQVKVRQHEIRDQHSPA
jgi:hypothetical protein